MKIEQDAKKFNPILITLESQGEADLLLAVTGQLGPDHEGGMLYDIFKALGGNDRLSEGKYSATGELNIKGRY